MMKSLWGGIVVALAVTLAGCGNANRQPRYDVPAPLEIKPFKREAAHERQDYIFTMKREAYSKVAEPMRARMSPSQKALLERHGQPDYVRRGFHATTGETVDEWAWWDRDVIAQFVQRELVWEGKLTDMDRTRIRYGYPRRSWSQTYESGVKRDIWDYQGLMVDTQGSIFSFADEKLVYTSRYQ